MFTIDRGMVLGSDLPYKGRMLLTNSTAFILPTYSQTVLLFKDSGDTSSSSLGFVSDDILYRSLEILVRDHYSPLTGWIDIGDDELYLIWDNYRNGVYSPKIPIHFETATIDTDQSLLCKTIQDGDPSLNHSKSIHGHDFQSKMKPLFFIKVTHLKNDSRVAVISIVFSHMVMDGCSVTNFYLNWAEVCRQMLSDPSLRLPLNYKIPHPPVFGAPDFSKFRVLEDKNYKEQIANKADGNINLPAFPQAQVKADQHFLSISEFKQKIIREKAHKLGVSFNTYLSAVLWKAEVALHFHQDPEIIDRISAFNIAVNIRPRLGVSIDLCSSALIILAIKSKVRDILEMNTTDLVQVIKKKLDCTTTPEGICGYADNFISLWKEACRGDGNVLENFAIKSMKYFTGAPMVTITSILNFKFSDVDFGLGGPVNISITNNPPSGSIHILPSDSKTDSKDIILHISVPKGSDIVNSPIFDELFFSDC